MSVACLLATIAVSSVLSSGAELRGSWSASSGNGRTFAGTWTAGAHEQSGGVTGTWTLREAAGKILMSGILFGKQISASVERRLARHCRGRRRRVLRNVDGRDGTRIQVAPG